MLVPEIQTFGNLLVSGIAVYYLHVHVFASFCALQITNWKAELQRSMYIVNFVYWLCISGSGELTVALLWRGVAHGDWCTLNAHTLCLLVWSYCNVELVMTVDWTLFYVLIFLFCCWSFTCRQLEVVCLNLYILKTLIVIHDWQVST